MFRDREGYVLNFARDREEYVLNTLNHYAHVSNQKAWYPRTEEL